MKRSSLPIPGLPVVPHILVKTPSLLPAGQECAPPPAGADAPARQTLAEPPALPPEPPRTTGGTASGGGDGDGGGGGSGAAPQADPVHRAYAALVSKYRSKEAPRMGHPTPPAGADAVGARLAGRHADKSAAAEQPATHIAVAHIDLATLRGAKRRGAGASAAVVTAPSAPPTDDAPPTKAPVVPVPVVAAQPGEAGMKTGGAAVPHIGARVGNADQVG